MAYSPPHHANVPLGLAYAYTPPDHRAVPLRLGTVADTPPPPVRTGVAWAVGAVWAGTASRAWADTASPWRVPRRPRVDARAGWHEPADRWADVGAPWRQAIRRLADAGAGWAETERLRTESAAPWAAPRPRRADAPAGPWTGMDGRWVDRALGYRRPPQRWVEGHAGTWEPHRREWTERRLGWRRPGARAIPERFVWEEARRLRWWIPFWRFRSQEVAWSIPPDVPVYHPPTDGAAVPLPIVCPLLDWPGHAVWLIFREAHCGDVPPRRRVYWVFNMISVVRLPDRVAVPCEAISLSVDYDSWAWDVRLALPNREALQLVAPDAGGPREVEITANGYTWTALVERYQDERRFGRSAYTVSGRSRSAYLAAPYAPARSYEETADRTAQQLAVAELGASGWSLAWDVVDWLVTAGAYTYRDLTPVQAIAKIAAAVGAKLQTDLAADTLRVLSRYPVSPWDWPTAEPDATITASILTSLSLEWQPQPAWNGVYVSGETQGVFCHVKRAGSDGTPYHPMVVDPLITHVDAGRERGRVILSGGGNQALVTVELPLFPAPQAPGLLTPGTLVEVQDGLETWRGLVTACRVAGTLRSLTQTVEIERRY